MNRIFFLAALLFVAARAGAAPITEFELLKKFSPGRLAALTAADYPDARDFTGGNQTRAPASARKLTSGSPRA